jgi:hypothetical protein
VSPYDYQAEADAWYYDEPHWANERNLMAEIDDLRERVEIAESAIVLLHAHSENLIERVYAIEEQLDIFHAKTDIVPGPTRDVETGGHL